MAIDIDYASARARLVEQLRQEIKDEGVLQAMGRVPREEFVPLSLRPLAYDDRPLPIGEGQTISQPFIIALMTSALQLKGEEKVLEVGTGSGYQAALLSLLASRVITVERLPSLAEAARRRLKELGYSNVEVYLGGKGLGYPPAATYDAILVTAAAPCLPPALVSQLGEGGRLVVPVGSRDEQDLLRAVLQRDGGVKVEKLGGCRFVPLIGVGAWEEECYGV